MSCLTRSHCLHVAASPHDTCRSQVPPGCGALSQKLLFVHNLPFLALALQITYGGPATYMEMCYNYIHYYPIEAAKREWLTCVCSGGS